MARNALGRGGIDVVDHRQRRAGAPYATLGLTQAAECLGTGVFVDDLAVDIKQDMALIIQGAHRVRVNVFVVKGFGSHFSGLTSVGAHSTVCPHPTQRLSAINADWVKA